MDYCFVWISIMDTSSDEPPIFLSDSSSVTLRSYLRKTAIRSCPTKEEIRVDDVVVNINTLQKVIKRTEEFIVIFLECQCYSRLESQNYNVIPSWVGC